MRISGFLWQSAYRGDVERIQYWVQNGANLEHRAMAGMTPLLVASDGNHTSAVVALLELGANVNAKDDWNETALMRSASFWPVSEALLEYNVNVDAVDWKGDTALMIHSSHGATQSLKRIVEKGANVNAVNQRNGWTALMYAGDGGHEISTRILIELGAQVDLRDHSGETALFKASKNGFANAVDVLLENGAAVDVFSSRQRTALMEAAKFGRQKVVSRLVDQGANLDLVDGYGATAIMFAVSSSILETVQVLIDNGAQINKRDNDLKLSVLDRAVRNDNVPIVLLLLNNGADVTDGNSSALFHAAAMARGVVMLDLLLNSSTSIKVDARDQSGVTPLMFASRYPRNADKIEFLIEKGANVNAATFQSRYTPLMYAAVGGELENVKVLIANGANVNATDSNGYSALMLAGERGKNAIVNLLIDYFTDLSIESVDGLNAFNITLAKGFICSADRLAHEMNIAHGGDQGEGDPHLIPNRIPCLDDYEYFG